ncbi:MAG: hypothetical protein ACR2OB_10550 [Solirubrobacteraceae bacterium]
MDAIHLATAQWVGASLAGLVTYDERQSAAARELAFTVVVPS